MDNLHRHNDNVSPKKIREFYKKWGFYPIAGAAEGDDWKITLPAEVKDDPSMAGFQTVGDLAKSWVGAQKFLGREKLPVPASADDKETFNLIFKKLGLPEKDTDYELPTDLEIPDDLPIDDELIGNFRKTSHELGLLPQQVAGIYRWYMKYGIDQFNRAGEAQKINIQEAETALRKKYGAAYAQNVALARKVVTQFADQKVFEKLEQGFGNNPAVIEMFVNIGKVLSEDQLMGKPSGLTLQPDEALIEIDKIKGDLKHPYWDATSPLHQEAVTRMSQLMKLAHP